MLSLVTTLSKAIYQNIKAQADKQRATHSLRFFKTGPGEYGEGDRFWGLTMPEQRVIAKKFAPDSDLETVKVLIYDEYHEARMIGWLILTYQYPKADEKLRKKLYQFYLKHAHRANNWDLVDVTAPKVVGAYLFDHPAERMTIFRLVENNNLWLRRIGVLACAPLIADGQFEEILKIAETLLNDHHDLMHKSVGWMLREVGKKDLKVLRAFLDKHASRMPRTMLRYAIEKMSEDERRKYLGLKSS